MAMGVSANTVTFWVARHGQTLFNVMSKVQGWCDTPLTEEGIAGAQSLGRGLADVSFEVAYSSDSGRAQQTLEVILATRRDCNPQAKGPHAVAKDARLREWCYGNLEGGPGEQLHRVLAEGFGEDLPFDELNRRLPQVADVIADWDESGRAERFADVQRRLCSFFREAGDAQRAAGGGNVLVVTHSFVIRTIIYLINPAHVTDPHKILNASVTHVVYDGERFSLGAVGSTAWQK